MTKPRDPEALLSAYLADGMEVLPDRVVNAVLDEIHRTRPRAVLSPWRTRSVSRATFAAAAVVAMLALGAALFVVAGGLSPTPSEEPSPSLPGVVAPSSPPSGPSAGPTASPVTSPGGVWIATGTMGTPRYDHAAVRLLDGRVLVVGGVSGDGSDVTFAELYDPLTGTWTATGPMVGGGGTATLLRDGKVLVAGVAGAQVYDPASGTWTATGKMVSGASHAADTATLLADGKVLVAGVDGAQLYDPTSGTWFATGKMNTPRYYATATLLPDGKVLAAGGFVFDIAMDSAELYDPKTGSWTAIANMRARHGHHTATLLRDGKVLVADWSDNGAARQFEVEVYDPSTGTWTALPVTRGIGYGTATLLSDGRVLVADSGFDSVAAELYDPSTGTWSTAAPMLRSHGTPALLLLDGTVLVAGGRDCLDGVCVATGSAELYVPAGVSPPPLPAFPSPPPPVIPSPTPRPTPFPPEAGPVPAGARSWKVTVRNESSVPATLFLAEDGESGIGRLCGSVTPNFVPPGVTVEVTVQLPPKSVKICWIWVNPVPGEGGSFFQTSDAPLQGEFFIRADGQTMWGGQ